MGLAHGEVVRPQAVAVRVPGHGQARLGAQGRGINASGKIMDYSLMKPVLEEYLITPSNNIIQYGVSLQQALWLIVRHSSIITNISG